ncbi:selenium metabolism-associated LysR family transcriptional regulator [Oceanobacillus sp. FSL W8-0428]|uniref:LysR family transcriptional regulator n=1 Tax=Oceanobacillus sojae TaxID=582851 RepID=A0A511ZGT3_9BACI|nr:selenium metabolism-associated LysR family transcriptional regulator [Oceanobacillus sojae]GEN86663.1 LysR family transcriptional regulator [Oceanobacillus sojae]
MNYEKLKTFIVVAEKKSFSEAAKLLFVTQPTITAQIKALEEELSTKLFERTTKKVSLTQSGIILMNYAKEIVRLNDTARKEITEIENTVYGELSIGCSFTIGEYIMPEFLKQFKDMYPLIQIKVDITNSNNIISDIKDQRVDVGLIETPIDDSEIVVESFLEDELILIASPLSFSSENPVISVDELKALPLIVRERGSGTRAVVNQYLNQSGVREEDLNIVMELGSTEAIKAAVEAKLGISITSKSAIKKEQKLNLLTAYKVKDVSFYRFFYTAYGKNQVLKSTAELFIEELYKMTRKRRELTL